MDLFGASLEASALGREVPEGGYHGDYINDLARQVVAENPGITDLPEGERMVAFRDAGYAIQLAEQQEQLANFRTHFDVWFSERSLHANSAVTENIEKLRGQGHLFEEDGALWMRTTDAGDDRDRVLIRSDGELTYFASDTAYYLDKRSRGFDICIYLLGADHHGYVGRLKAMAACAGDDPSYNLEVLIGQLVKILQNGEELKLSKRAGTIVTLEELVDLIGVDVAALHPGALPRRLTTDPRRGRDDPAGAATTPSSTCSTSHARTASIQRNAADLGLSSDDFDPSLLAHEDEGALLRALAEFPRVVAAAATLREPHRVARYLEATASTLPQVLRPLPRAAHG